MRKIIDSHLHISRTENKDYITCFDNYVENFTFLFYKI